ncbi:PAP2-C domain-containing protein [Aphelenchoides besseyi]|nr:PAP2-C domain-containing protein [Aphelenchoides besseyi]
MIDSPLLRENRSTKMPNTCTLPRLSKSDGQLLCPMGESHRIPNEIHKLTIVVFTLIIAGFSNWMALAYIHDFVGRTPLPDIIFNLVPEQSWALRLGDLMVTFCAMIMLTLMILHKYRAVVIRRVLFIIAVLYFMRTISLMCTQLPSGYVDNQERCLEQLNKTDRNFSTYLKRFLRQFWHVGFQDIENKLICGDMLFSGHTLIMVISSLTVQYYSPDWLRALQYVPKSFMCIGMICMILSRTHYTIDVIFAYWLSIGVFSVYHAFCEIDTYRERKNSVLSSILLIRMVAWLESNVVPGKLENTLELPFFRPLLRRFSNPDQQASISGSSSTVVIDPV